MSVPRTSSAELRGALFSATGGLLGAGAFSIVINLLMLAGPLYMMLVYDRVLSSGSLPTLIGLSVLVGGLFFVMGLLTLVRARLLVRVGNRLSLRLEKRVFAAQFRRTLAEGDANSGDANRDLGALREFFAGPTPATLFDAPWSPVFVLAVYIIHPTLGWIAAGGFAVLVLFGIANDLLSRGRLGEASERQTRSTHLLSDALRNAEAVAALRMTKGLLARWQGLQHAAQRRHSAAADTSNGFAAISRTVRLMLQSAVLGAGAYFVLQQEISAGAIIAASIIMGRGLAPAEQAIGSWRGCVAARHAWRRLGDLLAAHPECETPVALPDPKGDLRVEKLVAAAPGQTEPLLQNVSFELQAGETLAVIGPSGAGKSTLARALVGAWPRARGHVRIDGAKLEDWPDWQAAGMLGYLPQDVELFDGTVRENIARFAREIDDRAVVRAAQRAGVHEMILTLQSGYNAHLGEGGRRLSGGQRQRIGLARALYGNPKLVVLDEPNANLDLAGESALMRALAHLKEASASTVIIAHRPNVLAAADKVLVLENGRAVAFGPKQEVLSNPASGVRVGSQKVVSMPLKRTEQVR
ncbi:MAG: type I secretion system permease/ATPase [Alphaproteobacteria bacterium]|nr:type I secretion system permease/ATPase [Alphaproteobacteria bacterium]